MALTVRSDRTRFDAGPMNGMEIGSSCPLSSSASGSNSDFFWYKLGLSDAKLACSAFQQPGVCLNLEQSLP
jgi:hypothetical protein